MTARPLLAALSAAILAGPAAALSCLPHDAATTYQRLDAADEVYIAVHGTLDFDASALPQTDWADQRATPPETRLPARLRGKALGPDGFAQPFDAAVTLRVLCFGPWCAQPPEGAEAVAFVQKAAEGYVVTVDPCGGDAFFAPTRDVIETVQECFSGGDCPSSLPTP